MGSWTPSSQELDHLLHLYRQSIDALDSRLASIVREFREADRWKNTLFILTSDHGQAFGEGGMLFHALRVDEPLLRIPLWIRLPNREQEGNDRPERVSLVDVAPTVFEVTGVAPPQGMSGLPLTKTNSIPSSRRIFATADGVQSEESRLARWARGTPNSVDTEWVAVYEGDWKIVVNPTRETAVGVDLARGSREVSVEGSSVLQSLREEALSVGRALRREPGRHTSSEVADRLKSWGYD
jgi:arylsulfatase A-like enzyme